MYGGNLFIKSSVNFRGKKNANQFVARNVPFLTKTEQVENEVLMAHTVCFVFQNVPEILSR